MEANQDVYSSIMADSRNMIIKGKRTKRPRPSSPLSLTIASTASTTTTTSATAASHEDSDTENPNNTFHTTNSSIEFTKILQENEEEDMANCLILLAQSQSSPPQHQSGAEEAARASGICVYECKTCSREFSSFQALGGHRASHKKHSKPNLEETVRLQDVDSHHSSTDLSLQTGSNQTIPCNPSGSIKIAKIHECSICGAEFGSGQALGGHMRRHRFMPMARTNNCGDPSLACQEFKKPKTLLSLDLNLPASIEDDLRETELPFPSKDQMIMFSNSSVVYCHI